MVRRLQLGLARRRENVASALGAIRAHTLRSILTCLGIIIGVATVIVMVSIIEGFNQEMIASFERFGSTLVQFQRFEQRFSGGARPEEERLWPLLTVQDATAIKRNAWAIQYVSPEVWQYSGAEVRYRDRHTSGATVGGVTAAYPFANSHFVTMGRFFTESEERHGAAVAVIGKGVAEALFPFVDPLDRQITISGKPVRVIGVFEDKGGFLGGGGANQQIAIPMSVFDRIWPERRRENGVVIATTPYKAEWVPLAIEQGSQVLRERHGLKFNQKNDFAVRTPDQAIRTFHQITGGITAAMLAIAGISLIIGGVGVMNIMLMNVTQRTREIGVRRALGARRQDISQQFRTEAMTLSLVGGLTGVAVGFGLARLVGWLSPFPSATPLWAVAAGLAVSLAVGYVFGTYPAFRAAKLDPIEALRYE